MFFKVLFNGTFILAGQVEVGGGPGGGGGGGPGAEH